MNWKVILGSLGVILFCCGVLVVANACDSESPSSTTVSTGISVTNGCVCTVTVYVNGSSVGTVSDGSSKSFALSAGTYNVEVIGCMTHFTDASLVVVDGQLTTINF